MTWHGPEAHRLLEQWVCNCVPRRSQLGDALLLLQPRGGVCLPSIQKEIHEELQPEISVLVVGIQVPPGEGVRHEHGPPGELVIVRRHQAKDLLCSSLCLLWLSGAFNIKNGPLKARECSLQLVPECTVRLAPHDLHGLIHLRAVLRRMLQVSEGQSRKASCSSSFHHHLVNLLQGLEVFTGFLSWLVGWQGVNSAVADEVLRLPAEYTACTHASHTSLISRNHNC